MNESLKERVRRFLQAHRHRKIWEKLVGSLAVVVVFVTSYLLILPAITMEKTTYCGNARHTHTASCYEPSEEILDEDDISGSTGSASAGISVPSWTDSLSIEGIEEIRTGGEDEGLAGAETESESESESETESESESETETESESETKETTVVDHEALIKEKAEAEGSSVAETDIESEHASAIAPESESESTSESGSEPETEFEPESEFESESESETETETEAETKAEEETKAEKGTEAESEAFTEVMTESETMTETAAELESESETENQTEMSYYTSLMSLENEELIDEQADESGAMVNGAIDFKKYITSIKYKTGSDWKDVTEGNIEINGSDTLEFMMNYKLPAYTLSPENKTIVYQLPEGLAIKSDEQGKVYSSDNQEVGNYTISSDGKVMITFNDTYVQASVKGQEINGYIQFSSLVDESKTDDAGKKEINFNDSNKVTVVIKDKTITSEDLLVKKEYSDVDPKTGTVKYTITVSSKNGTYSDVSLKDAMDKTVLADQITITGKNGKVIAIGNKPNTGVGSFNITLPKMNAGDIYTVTYTAKLKELVNGEVKANNKVSAEAKREDGANMKAEDSVDVAFEQKLLEKTGELQADGKIKWTITINEGKADLKGLTLSDILNGKDYTGKVTISPAVNGQTEVTLPYTFDKDKTDANTYTITYITDADKVIGATETVNKAILKPSDSSNSGISDQGSIGDGEKYEPIAKKADGIREQDDNTALIDWETMVSAEKGDFPDSWYIEDAVVVATNKQWFTGEQLAALKNELDRVLKDASLNRLIGKYKITATEPASDIDWWNDKGWVETFESGKRYKKYRIEFWEGLKKGETFTFKYQTTASIEGITDKTSFTNNIKLNNVDKSATIDYTPSKVTVSKTDGNGDGNDNDKNYKDLQNGILTWKISLSIPAGYTGGEMTVLEKLPEGVELNSLNLWVNSHSNSADITADGIHELSYWSGIKYSITKSTDAEGIKVIIPQNLTFCNSSNSYHNPHILTFEVKAKIKEGFSDWSETGDVQIHRFENTVSIKNKSNDLIAEDSQAQTVKKEKEKPIEKKIVSKSHAERDSNHHYEGNIVPYSIGVNLDGEQLLDGKTLTLEDKLTYVYNSYDSKMSVTLVSGSVQVYPAKKENGKLVKSSTQPLDARQWSFVYDETALSSENEGKVATLQNRLIFTVPDGIPLLIEYKYKVSGEPGKWGKLVNVASLTGSTGKSNEDTVEFQIQKSAAGADTCGVTINKVDSRNYAFGLDGAVFELYRWDGNAYVKMLGQDGKDTFQTTTSISGIKGQLTLPTLTYNTAYKLVEIKAPTGYEIEPGKEAYAFFIENSDKKAYPDVKPDNFNGVSHKSGDLIYLPNTKTNEMNLEVEKKWFRADGVTENTGEMSGEIKFRLYRHIAGANETSDNFATSENDVLILPNPSNPEIETYAISQANNWKLTIENLPISNLDIENEQKYIYYVVEEKVANYDTQYINTSSANGSIVIKNIANPSYTLPETGGSGTLPYMAGGIAVLASGLLYGYSLRRRRERRMG